MATITSLGTGSGLELESLVTKLMDAEGIALTNLQTKQSSYEAKISALGSLKSSLSSLQTAAKSMATDSLQTATDKFAAYTASVANTSIASATASAGAVAGTYSLSVTQLAQAQRLASTTFTSSSSVVASSDSTLLLEMGTLSAGSYTADSARSYSINIAAGTTLEGLRDAINASEADVAATIINGTSGAQLILTGPEGGNSVMRLSGLSGFVFDPATGGTRNLTESQAAQDAEFTLNGIAATSHSNTVSDVLDGVTLELLAKTTDATGTVDTPTSLKITQDLSANLTKALQSFVSAYNSSYSTMSSMSAYDPTTQVAGSLQGNSTLRFAMSQIRSAVFSTTSGSATSSYQTLSNIGVSISSSGSLSLDTTKLSAAIKADPNTVSNLVANVGSSFDTTIENLIGVGGSVAVATDGLNKTVTDLEKQQTKMQERLDAIEARYRAQFLALDTLVASLTSTGEYLTSFLSSLSGSN